MTRRPTPILSLTRTQAYGVAVLAVILGAIGRIALDPIFHADLPLFLFIIPIILAGLAGGLGPGMLATALSLLLGDYLFMTPRGSIFHYENPLDPMRVVVFAFVGTTFSILFDRIRRALKADLESRQKHRFVQHVIDVSPSLITVYDVGLKRFVFVKGAIAAALGYDPVHNSDKAELFRSVIHPNDQLSFFNHLDRLANLRGEETAEYEFRMRHTNGEWHWFHSSEKVFTRNEDNSVKEIICISNDINERKNAEARAKFMADLNEAFLPLADPQQIMSVAVRMLGDFLGVDRCAYAELDTNDDYFVVMGEYTRGPVSNIVGRYRMADFGNNERRILLENRPYVVNDIETDLPAGTDLSLYRRGQIQSLVCVPLNKGRHFMARMAVHQKTPRHWSSEEITLISAVANRCWESVERARVARSLQESDERYRAFIANSSEAIWRFEMEQPIPVTLPECKQFETLYQVGYLAECNDAMARMHGYDRADQIVGMRMGDLLPKSDPQNIAFLRALAEAGYRLSDVETHGPDSRGNTRFFLNNLNAILENGAIVRAWGTCRDITDQKYAADALRESEERFAKAFKASPDALLISRIDDGTIIEVNDSFVSLSGYGRDEMIGKSTLLLDLYADPKDRQRALEILKGQNRVRDFEFTMKRKSGELRLMSFSAEPLDIRGEHCWLTIGHDITERKLAEEALRKSEEEARRQLAYVEAIYATAPVGLCFVDTNLRFRSINERLAEFNGKSVEEHLGRTIHEVVPEMASAVEPYYRRVIDTGEPALNIELTSTAGPGRGQHFLVSYYPIKNREGRVLGINVVVVEITQRKQAEQERERLLLHEKAARAEAEAANQMKDEFLATISHELRTPLTSILGWAHILSEGMVSGSQTVHALEVIEQNAKAQARLVDDILDTSRIITGRFKLETQPVDIEQVFQSAIDVIRPSAEAKRILLRVKIDKGAGMILGDASRLQQVIWNLLSNALKFTNEGGSVAARLSRSGDQIEISVSDTGIGIDLEFLPYVFDRFRQADSTSTRRYGGLGLGLAIVRHVVEMHGGSVSGSSPGKGRGSTFTITFPAASPVPLPQVKTEKPESELGEPAEQRHLAECQKLDGVHVLVVDDDRDTLELLKFIFNKCGATVITAASTAEALGAFERWQPDVLVSDLAMPDQDGYELIGRVRARGPDRGGSIPAVALSAYTRAEDRTRALSAGFRSHVSKPVDPEALVAIVASLAGSGHS